MRQVPDQPFVPALVTAASTRPTPCTGLSDTRQVTVRPLVLRALVTRGKYRTDTILFRVSFNFDGADRRLQYTGLS